MSNLKAELQRLQDKHIRVWPQFQALAAARKQARIRRNQKAGFAMRQEKERLRQAGKLATLGRNM